MKRVLTVLLCVFVFAAASFAQEKKELASQKDKDSYSLGYQVGGDFKRQGLDLNAETLAQGIKDGMGGATPLMTQQEMNQIMADLRKKVMATQQEERKKAGEKNLAEGKAFLEANKKKEGVKTTASGLQYKVIKEGDGPMPKATDKVTVHYKGTLIDGKEFDSSYSRNQPASFPVNGVIKGWTEALPLMKVGSKWQLFIPSDLAYGERGAGVAIGPNSVLVFEVELLSIEPAETAPAGK